MWSGHFLSSEKSDQTGLGNFTMCGVGGCGVDGIEGQLDVLGCWDAGLLGCVPAALTMARLVSLSNRADLHSALCTAHRSSQQPLASDMRKV